MKCLLDPHARTTVTTGYRLKKPRHTVYKVARTDCRETPNTALLCSTIDKELAHRLSGHPTLSFARSQWIWTPEVIDGKAPPGSRAFRKNFIAPYKLNGEPVATEIGWGHARSFCVPLQPHLNVFAVNATNNGNVNNAAGFLFTATITYMDGTPSTLVFDTTWRGQTNIPGGFQKLSYDDSSWMPVKSTGEYATDSIAIAGRDELSFAPARWIWTGELNNGDAPPGARAFRLTVTLPPKHTLASATILATADDYYSFYVNGRFVGSGIQYLAAQRFEVEDIQGPRIVFAVYAENKVAPGGWNPAGLISAIRITSRDPTLSCLQGCSITHDWFTDAGWKTYPGDAPPYGFELPVFDDSNWPYAVVRERISGRVSVPATSEMDEPGSPLPGAPRGMPSQKTVLRHQSESSRQANYYSDSQYRQDYHSDFSRYPADPHSQLRSENMNPDGHGNIGGSFARAGGMYTASSESADQSAGLGSQSLHDCACVPVNGKGDEFRRMVYLSA
ncbi:hypothetical protein J3R30DRAFT_3780817 [Lentinula aciculospora]|uniref:Bacterial alpha-L-rhamnosidase N-terminal domain-containing protein n=1 Tax=Lentinula aciculospora TaxID=153920 RepID=A0A9W9A3I6_9AGAR|nr:hypothetical protein J3R30DRAFT_3780817 [Lentinula aciculospora]